MEMALKSLIAKMWLPLASAVLVANAAAQGFPGKPVRLVIPFPPGGSSDAVGRIIGERLGEEWKQPVIIDNKPGAGTTIASAFVVGSAPDGYTLYLQGVSTHASAGALYKNLSFDPAKAFTPVANVSMSPFVLVVNNTVKANTAREMLQLGQAKPEALSYGSSGNGGSPHLFVEMLAAANGIKFLHVPYKGMGPAIVALIAGEVNFVVADVAVMPQVRAGKVRALAVTTPEPTPLVPGVPTVNAAGLPGYEYTSVIGFLAPAKTPAAIINRLSSELVQILRAPEVNRQLFESGVEAFGTTPEGFAARMKADIEQWRQIIRENGIKVEL